jgi:hypothetical protein
MRAPLHIVTPDEPATETVAAKVRRLQAEARQLAADQVLAFSGKLAELHAMAAEIHTGGEAYPAGARAIARDVMQDCESRGLTLQSITGRAS